MSDKDWTDAPKLTADDFDAAIRAVGAERYHDKHPFHKLLHGGKLDKGLEEANAKGWLIVDVKDEDVINVTRGGSDDDARRGLAALKVLEGASLVVPIWRGRDKLHYLNPVPIHEIAERWIGKFERGRLRALDGAGVVVADSDRMWTDLPSLPAYRSALAVGYGAGVTKEPMLTDPSLAARRIDAAIASLEQAGIVVIAGRTVKASGALVRLERLDLIGI